MTRRTTGSWGTGYGRNDRARWLWAQRLLWLGTGVCVGAVLLIRWGVL